MQNQVYTNIKTANELLTVLRKAEKPTIVKLGASWCGPCRTIEPTFYDLMNRTRNQFQWVLVDIDEAFELYGYLKKKNAS